METNNRVNGNRSKRIEVKTFAVAIYFIILVVLTISFYSLNEYENLGQIFLMLIVTSAIIYSCAKCCCRRTISHGAVLQSPPHVTVSQLQSNPNLIHTIITMSVNPANAFQTPPANTVQSFTPLITPYPVPSAPQSSDDPLFDEHKLPTYEEAIGERH